MSLKTLQYLSVNTTNYTSIMHRDYKQKEAQFWSEYLPLLSMTTPPTWPPIYEPIEEELRIYRAAMWAVLASLILLVFLTALCSCLYCRAKRYICHTWIIRCSYRRAHSQRSMGRRRHRRLPAHAGHGRVATTSLAVLGAEHARQLGNVTVQSPVA